MGCGSDNNLGVNYTPTDHIAMGVNYGRDDFSAFQKARNAKMHQMTGVDSPYEPPLAADLVLHTATLSVPDCIDRLLNLLRVQEG